MYQSWFTFVQQMVYICTQIGLLLYDTWPTIVRYLVYIITVVRMFMYHSCAKLHLSSHPGVRPARVADVRRHDAQKRGHFPAGVRESEEARPPVPAARCAVGAGAVLLRFQDEADQPGGPRHRHLGHQEESGDRDGQRDARHATGKCVTFTLNLHYLRPFENAPMYV